MAAAGAEPIYKPSQYGRKIGVLVYMEPDLYEQVVRDTAGKRRRLSAVCVARLRASFQEQERLAKAS